MSFLDRTARPLTLVLVLGLVAACSKPDTSTGVVAETKMDSLVTAAWLSEHIDDPNLVILDCTVLVEMTEDGAFQVVNGRAHYEEGHIPTAGFADLMGELADSDSPYQFAVPTPERFAAAMSALGVSDDSRVVLYDDSGSAWAARVWWMLRWIGFDEAALLDGGLGAWTAHGEPLSKEPVKRAVGTLTVDLRPELIVDKEDVLAGIGDDSVNIIDALSAPQYSGEVAMYTRPGHIPGATNVPMMSLIDETGLLVPADELDKLLTGDRDARSITYCGGGIAASLNAFVMTRHGYTDVAVYTASLQEWAADESLPMEITTAD